MFSSNSSRGVKKTAKRLVVLLLVVGIVGVQGHTGVKAQGNRRRPTVGVSRASAKRSSCEQLKADAERHVNEFQERVDNDLREIARLHSRFATRTFSYDDWTGLSDAEKKKAIDAAKEAALDLGLDLLKDTLVKIGDIGPIDAADIIKKYKITNPGLIDLLQKLGLANVYKNPAWAQQAEKLIDYLKAQRDVREIAARSAQGDTDAWKESFEVIFDVVPYQIERYAFSMPPYKQASWLKIAEAWREVSSGWSLSKSISTSGASIYATYISLKNIATLTALNEQDLTTLTKLNAILKSDVERLKQVRQDLTNLGDCPGETEIVFTYSVLGGGSGSGVSGLNPDFGAALRDQERLLNAAQATNDPTLKQLLLSAAAATNKNNVRVSTDPAYYAMQAAKLKDLSKKIDELQARIDALNAQGKVDAAKALEDEMEELVSENNKLMEQVTPQPIGPPNYITIYGDHRAGGPATKKGFSRVVVVNDTGRSIAASLGSGSVRLEIGGSFTRQVPAGRYALDASTTYPVTGRILRGQSSLTVEEGRQYEVSVALAKRNPEAGHNGQQGLTPQVRARMVGAQPRDSSASDKAGASQGGTSPLYFTYDGGSLTPDRATAPQRGVANPLEGEAAGPPSIGLNGSESPNRNNTGTFATGLGSAIQR